MAITLEAKTGELIWKFDCNPKKYGPYKYGGGHGQWEDSGYDCSGSVSYALAAAGLLSSPLDSTGGAP